MRLFCFIVIIRRLVKIKRAAGAFRRIEKGAIDMKKFVLPLLIAISLVFTACVPGVIANITPQKTTLTLAIDQNSFALRTMVSRFNDGNPDYFIDVIYYNNTKTLDDLHDEISEGNPPDIYAFSAGEIMETHISAPSENLLPYLENDPTFSVDSFVPAVVNHATQNGELFCLPMDFSVNAYFIQNSVVGEKSSITAGEARAYAAEKGSDIGVFPAWQGRPQVLSHIVSIAADSYIDAEAGTCNFNNSEFISLLELCAEVPEILNTEIFMESSGKNLLSDAYLFSLNAIFNFHYIYEQDYTFVGFEPSTGYGGVISLGQCFYISADSEHKDAAWAFCRTALNPDLQRITHGVPATTAEIDRQTQGFMANASLGFTEHDLQQLTTLLETASARHYNSNSQIETIMTAEALAYFNGAQTAETAAQNMDTLISALL